MGPIDPGSMPVWAQILITLAPVIAAAIAVARGYKVGIVNATTQPAPDNKVLLDILGGSFAEKHSSLAMIEVLREIKDKINSSTDELIKIRKAIEDHTESTVRRGRTSNRKPT